MDNIQRLNTAIFALKKSIIECPIGAVTLDDYKPIDEKIRDLRSSLLSMNSRIKRLKTQTTLHSIPDLPEGKSSELVNQFQDKLSNYTISNNLATAILQSHAVQEIFSNDSIDPEIRNKTRAIMNKLLSLNDSAIILHKEFNNDCLNREIELKDRCTQMLIEFSEFLREQEGIRNEKLAKTNPEVVEKKEKVLRLVYKINTMKRLITNFISTNSSKLNEHPELRNFLKNHRDLIRLDTIIELCRSSDSDERES